MVVSLTTVLTSSRNCQNSVKKRSDRPGMKNVMHSRNGNKQFLEADQKTKLVSSKSSNSIVGKPFRYNV